MRFEIIDHIATDVEENYSEIPFHEAIKIVLKKWEAQIKLASSFGLVEKTLPSSYFKKAEKTFYSSSSTFYHSFNYWFFIKMVCSKHK